MQLLFIIVTILLASAVVASFSAAPWVPVWRRDLKNILDLAQIKSGITFVDLGCGDGRVLVAAAKLGARAIGYEINFLPYILAKARQLINPKLNIKIYFKSFWNADLSQVDIVYCFLMPKVLDKLQTKINHELKPEARVISYVWPLPNWKFEQKIQTDKQPAIYLYLTKDNK